MPSENYDFTPWDSEDDIAKFFNDDIEKMPFLPALMGAGRAVLGAGKNLVSAGAKKLGLGGAKVGVKGAGAAAETATGAAKTAATSASEAVTSVAPKPTRLPKASDGTESVPLPKTPEAPEAPAASEPPVPEEAAAPEAAAKNKTKQMGMQMASSMMQQGAQKKQAQEGRAMDMARRGASIQTGEPMDIAWQLLKSNFFDNMRAKKKRGEKAAKPGHEDYPSKDQWKDITAKGEKPFHGYNPNKHSKKGGLNAKGRAAAKRKTGANLKKPVTKKPSSLKPGGKAAGRRKSFCARMTGVKGPTSKKGKLTPKGASLKRWNC